MIIYTYSEARQNFSTVLEKAKSEGKVLIKRRDGSSFILTPVSANKSPLNVKGIRKDIKSSEIIDILKEIRSR
jgi:antitoxin (DNA-binding transcriptional repressor) of toxin-antitoxin stability system